MKRYKIILIGLFLFNSFNSVANEPKDRQFTVSHSILKQGSTKTIITAGYLIYYPENYETNVHEKFPVVLHLHGAGEGGTDIDILRTKTNQLPGLVHQKNFNYPFIIVSPLAKSSMDAMGNYDYLEQIMAHVRENNRIDTSREYVAGLSQGGKAARKYAERNAETIAGLISASGYSGGTNIEGLVAGEVPIILSHNEDDTVISINSSNGYYKKLVAAGATRLIFDIEETGGHGSWSRIYTNMYYWDWLFSFSNDLDGIDISNVSFTPTTLTEDSTQLQLTIKVNDSLGDVQGVENVQVDFSSILGGIVTMSTDDNEYFDVTYDIHTPLTAGTYSIKVTVLDKEGNTKNVDYDVSVLEAHNEAPLVNIIQPLVNSTYDTDEEINILVNASDSDGEITLVEFYADGILIGSDTQSPYELLNVNYLTPGTHTLSAKAYDDSDQQTQANDITITIETETIPHTEGITVLAIKDAGKAEGSSYFPMEKAFDSQPDYSEAGLSDVDGGDRAPAYSNRYGYIDFGENWRNIRIAQTWTYYRASSAGDHTPYTQVWWDDDIDTVNDSNLNETNINFNSAKNLAYSSSMTWSLDNDMTNNPVTPLNRYLLLKAPDAMTYRASEYAFIGWVEVDAVSSISNYEDTTKASSDIEIAVETN